eukprot:s1098_g8.t1
MADRAKLLPSSETCVLVPRLLTMTCVAPARHHRHRMWPRHWLKRMLKLLLQHFAPLREQEIEVDGVRPTADSDMQALRAACELMRLSIRGRKVECFERWGKHIAEQRVIMHNEGKLSTVLHHSTLHSAQLRGPATSRFPTTSKQLQLNESYGSQNRKELEILSETSFKGT